MLNFRANDIFDELYRRYLESFGLTLDSADATGQRVYDYYCNQLLSSFKTDIKSAFFEIKMYKKYLKKRRKLEIKYENLGFYDLQKPEIDKLKRFARYVYYRKRKKYCKLNRKGFKLHQKYYLYLPIPAEEENTDNED